MPTDLGPRPLLAPAGVASLLSTIIHERTGISFDPDRYDTLLEKLQPLAEERGCYSFLDFYYLLKYDENGAEDWQRVLNVITVQETYFFREMPQIDALVKFIIPRWFEQTTLPLQIWCAASATGEEAYSIALTLVETGWGDYPIRVQASDASPAAVSKARQAIYRENSFRTFPTELRQKYFSPAPGGWQLSRKIAERVIFRQANLLFPPEIDELARSPVIFCRNVFIYFSHHAIRQVLATLATRMPRQGWLFVGATESLLRMTADFQLREIGGAFGYVRI